jgi:transglutaminase-like putative cysteine protease
LTDGELYYHGFDPTKQNLDPDRDHLPNRYERKYGTNPFSKDTDGDGISDADEVFSYPHILNPLKPDAEKLLSKIPNVEAKLWPWFGLKVKKIDPDELVIYSGYISPDDPLVQYYAKHTKIKWKDGDGRLFVDGKKFFLKYDIEKARLVLQYKEGWQPFNAAYMLSHGREGICQDAGIMSCSVLKASGYPSIYVYGWWRGKGHAWTETYINGKVYVVNFNDVILREKAYSEKGFSPMEMWDDDVYRQQIRGQGYGIAWYDARHEYDSEWYKVYV